MSGASYEVVLKVQVSCLKFFKLFTRSNFDSFGQDIPKLLETRPKFALVYRDSPQFWGATRVAKKNLNYTKATWPKELFITDKTDILHIDHLAFLQKLFELAALQLF